ncbi:MAG TPA: hypothetical protein VIH56_03065 [Candidatus Acidoferrales bacterium]
MLSDSQLSAIEPGPFEELAQAIRSRTYKESYYSLIASYMDESFDMQPRGVFAVGGFLGRGVPIFELERRWEQLRKRPDINIAYFKASECEHGRGEFAKFVQDPENISLAERSKLDSISHEFLKLIVNPVAFDNKRYFIVHGVGIVQEDFYEVIKEPRAKAILGHNPYRLAYDFAMIQCAWAMKRLEEFIVEDNLTRMSDKSSREYVSFVCDEHEKYSPLAHEAYRNLKETNPNAADYMATFTSGDEKKLESLQAADAAVFEVRRVLNLVFKQWPGKVRKQFNLLRGTVMFLITHSTKDQLLHIVNTHSPGEPFKLDSLMNTEFNENIALMI